MPTPTPYDTGKIKIGSHYDPPPPSNPMSIDDLLIQSALLDATHDSYKHFPPLMPTPSLRWSLVIAVAGVAVLLAAGI